MLTITRISVWFRASAFHYQLFNVLRIQSRVSKTFNAKLMGEIYTVPFCIKSVTFQ